MAESQQKELFRTQAPTSSTSSGSSTSQHQAIYAAERARMLFGGYRRGDANDPDMYVASIAAVLATYDADLIARVTDPRTGISTHEKFRTFMPNSGELKAYCDEQQAIRDKFKGYAALPRPTFKRLPSPPPRPGHRANVFVPTSAPQYAAMLERARAPDADPLDWRNDGVRPGIWVTMVWLESVPKGWSRVV